MKVSILVQVVPLQLPHVGEHFTLYFLHVHLVVVTTICVVITPYYLNRSSGAGAKSVNNGKSHHTLSPPIPVAEIHYHDPSTLLLVSAQYTDI